MKRTTIMAEEETLYKIDRIAKETGKSKGEIIREALTMYIVEAETKNPPKNPLLGMIGLAGGDAKEMDLSNGNDEQLLDELWNKKHEERDR